MREDQIALSQIKQNLADNLKTINLEKSLPQCIKMREDQIALSQIKQNLADNLKTINLEKSLPQCIKMKKNEIILSQIKQNVADSLKTINLAKKDRNFLLDLIKLFDLLSKNEEETFVKSLILLINNAELEKTEELDIRLRSLNTQLEQNKFSEIRHYTFFSFYIQKEKIDIYIKKISINWDLLITEIKKIEFNEIHVIVYRSISKKEKILNKKLAQKNDWEEKLTQILENNICINVHIILELKKENLV